MSTKASNQSDGSEILVTTMFMPHLSSDRKKRGELSECTHPGPGVGGEAVGPLGWHVGRIAPLSVPRGISYVCASVELKYTTQQTVPRKRGSQFWDQDMQELD